MSLTPQCNKACPITEMRCWVTPHMLVLFGALCKLDTNLVNDTGLKSCIPASNPNKASLLKSKNQQGCASVCKSNFYIRPKQMPMFEELIV